MKKSILFYITSFFLFSFIAIVILELFLHFFPFVWRPIYNQYLKHDDNTYNVYVVGGSTSYGEPYGNNVSFPEITKYMLGGKVNGKEIRIINLARPGANVAEAYWRLFHSLFFQPPEEGALLIYSGINDRYHDYNEPAYCFWWIAQKSYLFSKIWFVIQNNFIDCPRDSEDQYEIRLNRLIQLAQKNKLNVYLSTLVSNYRGYSPRRVGDLFDSDEMKIAMALKEQGKFVEALEIFQNYYDTQEVDKSYFLDFQIADCLYNVGEIEKAWQFYKDSADPEFCLRAPMIANDLIRASAIDNRDVVLVDTFSNFEEVVGDELIGYNLMSDAHHPNIKGYGLIAKGFASAIAEKLNTPLIYPNPSEEDIKEYLTFDEGDLFDSLIYNVLWHFGAAIGQNAQEDMPFDVVNRYLEQARSMFPERREIVLAEFCVAIVKGVREDMVQMLDKYTFLEDDETFLGEHLFWLKNYEEIIQDILIEENLENVKK